MWLFLSYLVISSLAARLLRKMEESQESRAAGKKAVMCHCYVGVIPTNSEFSCAGGE